MPKKTRVLTPLERRIMRVLWTVAQEMSRRSCKD